MAKPWRPYPSFFFSMSLLALAVTVIGFGKTFFIPLARNTFSAPLIIHIHGALAFSWILLFLIQSVLIHFRNIRLHIKLGYTGIFITAGVAITMVPAGAVEVSRNLAAGADESSYSTILGTLLSAILFLTMVAAGIWQRKKPEYHKRWLLLATIVVLWPAWFRFRHYFPAVPRPEIWFGLVAPQSLILVGWICDYSKNRTVHPVLKLGGLFVILEQWTELLLFDTAGWRQLSKALYFTIS